MDGKDHINPACQEAECVRTGSGDVITASAATLLKSVQAQRDASATPRRHCATRQPTKNPSRVVLVFAAFLQIKTQQLHRRSEMTQSGQSTQAICS